MRNVNASSSCARRTAACVFSVAAACALAAALLCVPGAAFADPAATGADADRAAATEKGSEPVANPIEPAITPDEAQGSSGTVDTSEPLDDPNNKINTGQLPDSSFLYDTSIAALAGADSYYDGQEVQVTGEVVGEPIRFSGSSDFYWVVLAAPHDNASIMTFMRASDVRKIDTFGAYGKTGSIVKVRGTFNLVCGDHEGESDLHVASVTVVEHGSEHPDIFDYRMFIPGLIAIGVGLVLVAVFWFLRERKR